MLKLINTFPIATAKTSSQPSPNKTQPRHTTIGPLPTSSLQQESHTLMRTQSHRGVAGDGHADVLPPVRVPGEARHTPRLAPHGTLHCDVAARHGARQLLAVVARRAHAARRARLGDLRAHVFIEYSRSSILVSAHEQSEANDLLTQEGDLTL